MKAGATTLAAERGNHARLCVQVDLSQPLVSMLTIGGRCCKIEYEGLHLTCFHYGCYGHRTKESEENIVSKVSKHGERFPDAIVKLKTKPLMLQNKMSNLETKARGGSENAKASNSSRFWE